MEGLKLLLSSKKEFNVTKKGDLRQRKKFVLSKEERTEIKIEIQNIQRRVKPPCSHKSCKKAISKRRRRELNKQFWGLSFSARYTFGYATISRTACKYRKKNSKEIRSNSFSYHLKNDIGKLVRVCKHFYLSTLGYEWSNDSFIRAVVGKQNYLKPIPQMSAQGKHTKTPMKDRQSIIDHVNSFKPTVHHYRRVHAPKRKYLPSDLTIKAMHGDYIDKKLGKCSYDLYRQVVSKDMNISFAQLGHEECEACEEYELHDISHPNQPLDFECEICKEFAIHRHKYTESRKTYDSHRGLSTKDHRYASGDLMKVVMLPRLTMFKAVLFTPRVIAFNESIVPIGKNDNISDPIAYLWHEAIMGRYNEDIISCFYKYFLSHKDVKKFTMWLDNCSAQNKNWAFFGFLVHIINSTMIAAEYIEIYYFEPGHTFMSADHFHHQVEQSLNPKKKVYNFEDYVKAVKNSNRQNVTAVEMTLDDFYEWRDAYSYYKVSKTKPRPYLADMVYVRADRGSLTLKYRKEYSTSADEFNLDFLQAKFSKSGVPLPPKKSEYRGISKERKEKLIKNLGKLMPDHKLEFWETLAETDSETKLGDEL